MIKINEWMLTVTLAAFLAGCSTTTSAPKKVDEQTVLNNRLQLATEYLRNDNHQGVRDHLQRALEIDSRSAEAHDLLALLYTRELEPEVAERHYRKAISFEPGFTRARNNYGSFLYNNGRYREAYKQFSAGADDLDYALRYEIFGKMGLCSVKLKQREQARRNFGKAIALNRRWPLPYLELAELEHEDSNYATAQRYLKVFEQLSTRPSAKSLWLGIRLDDLSGDKDARGSKGLVLKNRFPNSEENRRYQNWLKNERQNSNKQ